MKRPVSPGKFAMSRELEAYTAALEQYVGYLEGKVEAYASMAKPQRRLAPEEMPKSSSLEDILSHMLGGKQ